MKMVGCATPEATESYAQRFAETIAPGHFRQAQGLMVASIGLGTYLGNFDDATDRQYCDAIVQAVQAGCNLVDSAINYRCQRSERAIAAALQVLDRKGYRREEIVVATKGGFIPYDGTPAKDMAGYFADTFVKPGIAQASDIVANCHCMTPKYLTHQIDCSLRNLGLDCIDFYYLHNPETQLGKIPKDEFKQRLLSAFEALEAAVGAGKIRRYGAATWNGFRAEPTARDYLSLSEMVDIAAQAGGREHHFKIIQLPVNLGMSEALSLTNQMVKGKSMTLLEAAQGFGITVMCSAAILQGQLTHDLPPVIYDAFPGLATDGQRALQFVRSTPGVTSALVGMKQSAHVAENLATAKVSPASWEQYSKLFQSA